MPDEKAVVKYDAAACKERPVRALTATRDGKQITGLAAFSEVLKTRRGSIVNVAASFMNPERVIKVALNNFAKNDGLYGCTPDSIFRCILMSAELGLEPGGALQEAHLIPFGTECTLIVDYKGLEQLAYRSGQVTSINASCVYQGDTWEYENGLDPKLRHVPADSPRDPNKITHAFCVVKLVGGGTVYDVMTKAEIDAIRGRSRAGQKGPWVTDYGEMAKKTVLRRTLKHCPRSVELQRALAIENATDTGDYSELDLDVIEGEVVEKPTKTERLKAKLEAKDDVAPAPAPQPELPVTADPFEGDGTWPEEEK